MGQLTITAALTMALRVFYELLKRRNDPAEAFARALNSLRKEARREISNFEQAVATGDADTVADMLADLRLRRRMPADPGAPDRPEGGRDLSEEG